MLMQIYSHFFFQSQINKPASPKNTPVSPAAVEKRPPPPPQPKPIKAQGINIVMLCKTHFFSDALTKLNLLILSFKEVKSGNSDRQSNGPVVVKASKDKKKVNQKVSERFFFF